jgi:hypothetical protein
MGNHAINQQVSIAVESYAGNALIADRRAQIGARKI